MNDTTDMPRQAVLVLGAGGFVGSRLVRALLASPHLRPIAAVHRPGSEIPGVEAAICDATDAKALGTLLPGVAAVVNCVAGSADTMIRSATALCQAARQQPPRRIVHLSSMAVYGQAVGAVDEATQPVPPFNDYARGKQVCEEIMRTYVRDGGDAVILRPGCVYGPGSTQWTLRIARLLRTGRIGDLGAAGDGIANLVLIEDLIDAILSALTQPGLAGMAFNISGPEWPTWNGYFLRFARLLRATPVRRVPERQLRLETRVGAPAFAIGGKLARLARLPMRFLPEPIPPSLVRLWQQDITLDNAQALHRLELSQTPLSAGLDASVRWLNARVAPPNRIMERRSA
jgi:nucleoside-diphosphate-sugar epimerase